MSLQEFAILFFMSFLSGVFCSKGIFLLREKRKIQQQDAELPGESTVHQIIWNKPCDKLPEFVAFFPPGMTDVAVRCLICLASDQGTEFAYYWAVAGVWQLCDTEQNNEPIYLSHDDVSYWAEPPHSPLLKTADGGFLHSEQLTNMK